LVVAVVVVAVAIGLVANARRPATIGRSGSTALASGQPVLPHDRVATYVIEYRLEERVSSAVRTSTETVSVRRPFDGRIDTRTGGKRIALDVWTLGRSSSRRSDADALVTEWPPQVAGADVRLEPALSDALRAGVLQRRERRRVAGRTCQVFRGGDRVIAATMVRPAPSTYVDTCVDADGLVLEELRVVDGKRDLRRVALRVRKDAALADAAFAVGPKTIDVPSGGGSTRPVDPASTPPGQFWQLDAPPAGFTPLGRYAIVPPQPENFTDATREGMRRAGVVDVYVRGIDVVFVERGGTLKGADPWTVDPANPTVDLGAVGPGEIVLTPRGVEVRALTGGGHYVRVFGTLPASDLAAIARQLHAVAGTALRYLDG
jgi:hypothetical protein